jgi:nicotinamide riboside transporter PnuC
MSMALILNIVLTVFTTVSIAAIAWWARKHPNRAKEYPERVRMPKVLAIFGWICLCVGLLMGLLAFTSARAPLGARIASVAILLGGMAFLVMYRNFYVVPGAHEVVFRSVLGKENVLSYSDITYYNLGTLKGQQFLMVKSSNGIKLSLNVSAYDMTPLLRAIEFREVTGRWPVRPAVSAQESQKNAWGQR